MEITTEILEALYYRLENLRREDKSIASLERQDEVLDTIILIQEIEIKNLRNEK